MKFYNFYLVRKSIALITIVLLTISCNPSEETHDYAWFDFVVQDLDTTKNEIDLSFLNEDVAGEQGFVTVKDGHFVKGEGEPIRFFGTNLTFGSAFPDKEIATKIAARLAKMGMNVVRFHHLDMRAAPSGIWDSTMLKFDPAQVEKLDWLIYQLKMHGVYTNLNLHVSRTYPGVEDEIARFRFGKSIDHFHRPYIEMQKDYARTLLTHVNPYSGNSYVDEPAVAFIELNNENSLLSNWQHLPELTDKHKEDILRQWISWLKSENISPDGNDLFMIIDGYDADASKVQKEYLWKFLFEIEMNYAKELSDFVRNDLKAQPLIADSQASYSGVAGIHREAEYSDWIDMHAYWEHPKFPGESWSRTNWLVRNTSMVSDKKGGTLSRFSQHRVEGMPLTISEYDHPAPNFYCAEMYPMLNAVAAFQDWDGIYHFTFNNPWDEGRISGFFSSAGHPLKQIFIPVGSVIFRMGAVAPGRNKVQLQLPRDQVINELVNYGNILRLHGSNVHLLWEREGAPIALPILRPYEVSLKGDKVKLSEAVDRPSGAWMSETKELTWDNRDSLQSVFTINAEAVKGAVGYIAGKDIELGDVTIKMDSTEFNWGVITLTSLDGESINDSKKVLLVAAGRVENANMEWNADKTSVGSGWGNSPSRVEGIPAKISFKNAKKFKAYALDPQGNIGNEVKVYKPGYDRFIVVGAQHKTLWYILKR